MVVRRSSPHTSEQNCELKPVILTGINQRDFQEAKKVPKLGEFLYTASQKVPVAADFTAQDFWNFYHRIEADLEKYGRIVRVEQRFAIASGYRTTLSDCQRLIDENQPLQAGSYINFQSEDKSLDAKLAIGPASQKNVEIEEDPLRWAKEKVEQMGPKGTAVAAGAALLFGGVVALAGLAEIGRRIYNQVNPNAQWVLEFQPRSKVTLQQQMAYAEFIVKYSK